MKKEKLLALVGGVCIMLILVAAPVISACAKPAPAPAPAPTPAPAPAPAPAPTPTPETITLRSVTFLPVDFAASQATMGGLVKEVEERSNGELIIDWIGGPEAIPMFGQHEAAISGAVDIVCTVGTFYKDRVPESASIVLSTISPEEMRETGYYDALKEAHMKANLHYLGLPSFIAGYNIWLVRPIERPEELAGLRVPSDPARDPILKAFGMGGVDIDDAEVFTGLDRGIIDGVIDPVSGVWDGGLYEAVNYFIDPPWFSGGVVLIMNLDSWRGLPEHLQNVLTDSAIALEDSVVATLRVVYAEYYENVIEAGVEPINFSPSDTEWYLDTIYSAAWKDVENMLGLEKAARLRELNSK